MRQSFIETCFINKDIDSLKNEETIVARVLSNILEIYRTYKDPKTLVQITEKEKTLKTIKERIMELTQ